MQISPILGELKIKNNVTDLNIKQEMDIVLIIYETFLITIL